MQTSSLLHNVSRTSIGSQLMCAYSVVPSTYCALLNSAPFRRILIRLDGFSFMFIQVLLYIHLNLIHIFEFVCNKFVVCGRGLYKSTCRTWIHSLYRWAMFYLWCNYNLKSDYNQPIGKRMHKKIMELRSYQCYV